MITEAEIKEEILETIKGFEGDIDLTSPQKMAAGITDVVIKVIAKREERLRGQLQYLIDKMDKLKPTAFF